MKKPCKFLTYKALKIANVLPKGFEPLSLVPETNILSIELRKQVKWWHKIKKIFSRNKSELVIGEFF